MVNFSFKVYLWGFKWVLRREVYLNPKGTFIIWWVILKMGTYTKSYTTHHRTEIMWINMGNHTYWNDKPLPCQNVCLIYLNISEWFHARCTDISKLLWGNTSLYNLHMHQYKYYLPYTHIFRTVHAFGFVRLTKSLHSFIHITQFHQSITRSKRTIRYSIGHNTLSLTLIHKI